MTEHVTAGILISAALSMAVTHTAVGVDHTLPLVALSSARDWSLRKTLLITAACGTGHVLSSVLLGFVGLALGVALDRLEWIEAASGGLSGWLLIGFGVVLSLRATYRANRLHSHGDHAHLGLHDHPHGGVHTHGTTLTTITPLFAIFVLGPCEPLIPLMLAPGAAGDWQMLACIVVVFSGATIATMMALVTAARFGISFVSSHLIERHSELFAGLTLVASGVAIKTLGI